MEVALNGVDYISNEDIPFTFIGPNAGKMLWVYILITIFTALLIILLAALISSYWTKMQDRSVYTAEEPHVKAKRPKYWDEEKRLEDENQ